MMTKIIDIFFLIFEELHHLKTFTKIKLIFASEKNKRRLHTESRVLYLLILFNGVQTVAARDKTKTKKSYLS